MVELLVGAILAVCTGWVGQWLVSRHSGRLLAAALLAEIDSTDAVDPDGGTQAGFKALLDEIAESGVVEHPGIIRALFDYSASEIAPVYYASVDRLGLLPYSTARDLVAFHSSLIGLARSAARQLGAEPQLDPEVNKVVAASISRRWSATNDLRVRLVADLRTLARLPTPTRVVTPSASAPAS